MEFCRSLVDYGGVRLLGNDSFDVDVDRREEFARTLQGEKGVVLVLAHVGAWMAVIPYLNVSRKPIRILLHPDHVGAIQPHRDALGDVAILDTSGPFGGLIEATAALERGEIVGVMGDRPLGGRTAPGVFFGDAVPVLLTPYRLARATGSRLIVVLARRSGPRRFAITLREIGEPPSGRPLSENERSAWQAAAFLAEIESFLQEHPYLWFNFYDFWQTAPAAGDGARR
jgi:predicted LPLAT superfamily acyltransferase